jgi:methyltransferase (TIGR00027 family)
MDARHTASPIARIRALEGKRPEAERLFTDPYAALFDDSSGEVTSIFEQIPFFAEHVRLRTRYIDDSVRGALSVGIRTIVLVGAGFDARALRMPEIAAAGARVVEVDHGDQLAEKRRRLAAAGVDVPERVVFAPADLSEGGALPRALRSAGLAERERVHFICEGLFGYLSHDALRDLAERTAAFSGEGSSLIGNHDIPVWSSEALASAFASSSWRVTAGPRFDHLYRTLIGGEPPPGADDFSFLTARR